jgi:hypothetical protein
MTFADAMSNAMEVWFGTDFADSAILNGQPVLVQAKPVEPMNDSDGLLDHLDVEFQIDDYPTVAYRTDTLSFNGTSWRYPVVVAQDSFTRTVRFSSNKRPIARGR